MGKQIIIVRLHSDIIMKQFKLFSILYMILFTLVSIQFFTITNNGILCVNRESFHLHNYHQHHNHNYHHNHHHHHHHNRHNHHNGPSSYRSRPSRAVYLAKYDSNSSADYSNNNIQNDQPQILEQCNACDEAKYELVFEGLWSRYTHPDDFPENYWLAYFSDIIGASHSNEFKMWNQDTYASDGVKELAETGSTKKLESELKQVSSKTRTIIKARELRYPTLNSKTSAVFRTDRQHHLVSILSKLGPSPDWMVGVSSLELCQPDRTWANQRIVNLYLWDAGTDSGTTFTSSDLPSRPAERIHPFRKTTSTNSNNQQQQSTTPKTTMLFNIDTDSYDAPTNYQKRSLLPQQQFDNMFSQTENVQHNNNLEQQQQQPLKPFARLTVTRQRIYEKSCNGDGGGASSSYAISGGNNNVVVFGNSPITSGIHRQIYQNNIQSINSWTIEPTKASVADCRFTDWSDWSTCSSTCGRGIRTRTRAFLEESAQLYGCSQIDLIEKEVCLSECVGTNGTTCITRDWSPWSRCSVNCGQGYRKRTRSPIGPMRRGCESIEYVETEACIGSQSANCTLVSDGGSNNAEQQQCELTDWSNWSDCSVFCGKYYN